MFEMLKVFDTQDDVPPNIRESIGSFFEDYINGNHTYILFYTESRDTLFDNEEEARINNWLLDTGANENEKVLILYWW